MTTLLIFGFIALGCILIMAPSMLGKGDD